MSTASSGPTALRLPLGFQWGSATAGLKASGKPDVALAICEGGASATALFTSNQVVAAPVTVGRRHLEATGGRVTAVLVNSGNANCATGEAGIEACHRSCIAVAEQFGSVFDEVIPSSTGIIGVPLPTEKLIAAVPSAKASLGSTPEHILAFANAIMTTDTKRKVARATIEGEDGQPVRLFGCAKGAGMIGPQLVPHATMLVYLFTDLEATPAQLRALLAPAVESSFNSMSIDGDTSTNDTVLLLASGKSGVQPTEKLLSAFGEALQLVCNSLAHQIVDDGEGVGHVVTLYVTGAHTDAEAKQIARNIARSPLCKTAWSSADPNWGRLLCAAGYAGVGFDPATVSISIGGLPVFAQGVRSPHFDEAATHAAMSVREYTIALDFGVGEGRCRFLTCDLTHEYVSINADYSS
ncbi:MAG: bifunctional glutamate N-acetyltransferase/amino-acid acetyltransferase ArgJ [Janthinobacterium lividum]